MGRSLEDFPEQVRSCAKCGRRTYETQYYACDCGESDEGEVKKCPECDAAFDPDLFKELRGCYDHTDDLEALRQIAAGLDQYIDGQRKVVTELVKDNVFLKRGWETKDARIHELELGVDALDKGLKRLQELQREDKEAV